MTYLKRLLEACKSVAEISNNCDSEAFLTKKSEGITKRVRDVLSFCRSASCVDKLSFKDILVAYANGC